MCFAEVVAVAADQVLTVAKRHGCVANLVESNSITVLPPPRGYMLSPAAGSESRILW